MVGLVQHWRVDSPLVCEIEGSVANRKVLSHCHGQRINGNPKRGFIEDGRGMTILLADDEAGIRDLVGRVLRSHGYTVLEAADGAAALEVAEQHAGPIHLLLTDWCMPRLGGEVLDLPVE